MSNDAEIYVKINNYIHVGTYGTNIQLSDLLLFLFMTINHK